MLSNHLSFEVIRQKNCSFQLLNLYSKLRQLDYNIFVVLKKLAI